MRDVQFIRQTGDQTIIRAWTDLGLFLADIQEEAPDAKRITVDVPGTNGKLDYTNQLGGVKFTNHTIKLIFTLADYQKEWDQRIAGIKAYIHGDYFRVYLSGYAWYWDAFVMVDNLRTDRTKGTVTVKLDANPFQLANITFDGSLRAGYALIRTFDVGVYPNRPQIYVSGACTLTHQYTDSAYTIKSYSLSAGSWLQFDDLILSASEGKLMFSGASVDITVQVKYIMGRL